MFELSRLAGEPVEVVGEYAVKRAVLDVAHQALVLGPDLSGVSRNVVVDVLLGDSPTKIVSKFPEVLQLALTPR